MKSLSRSLLGLTACFLPALLLGCGGGGGGPATPRAPVTPTATPVSTTNSTNANGCAATYAPNYAAALDRLQRWPGFPLRIFLGDTNARTRALTLRGFNQWVEATGGGVRYKIVSDRAGADITVSFAELGDGDELGITTTYFFRGQNTIQSAEIEFFYYPFDSRADAEATNQAVAAHEFGHALGLGGHSPVETDLMYFQASGGAEPVTERDLNTLRTSYCDNFPTRNSNAIRIPQGTLEKFVISLKRNGCTHENHR